MKKSYVPLGKTACVVFKSYEEQKVHVAEERKTLWSYFENYWYARTGSKRKRALQALIDAQREFAKESGFSRIDKRKGIFYYSRPIQEI